jgi:hypothetical protein
MYDDDMDDDPRHHDDMHDDRDHDHELRQRQRERGEYSDTHEYAGEYEGQYARQHHHAAVEQEGYGYVQEERDYDEQYARHPRDFRRRSPPDHPEEYWDEEGDGLSHGEEQELEGEWVEGAEAAKVGGDGEAEDQEAEEALTRVVEALEINCSDSERGLLLHAFMCPVCDSQSQAGATTTVDQIRAVHDAFRLIDAGPPPSPLPRPSLSFYMSLLCGFMYLSISIHACMHTYVQTVWGGD